MSITIDLPAELEERLSREARARGVSLADHLLQVLLSAKPKASTGAELVAYWQREGLIGTRPEIVDPAGHARKLRTESEHRGNIV